MGRTPKTFTARAVCALVALAGAPACSGDTRADVGESCDIDGDCKDGLSCRNGACIEQGGGTDDPDAGDTDGGEDGGFSPVITDEDYLISFIRFSDFGGPPQRNLFVVDTSNPGGQPVQVNSDPLQCNINCWLTDDVGDFVYMADSTATPGTYDIFVAPVDGSYKAGTPAKLLEGVDDVRLTGDVIVFSRTNNGTKRAYYRDISGTQDRELGDLGDQSATQGSAVVSPEANKAVLLLPKLQTLDLSIGELGDPLGQVDYTFDGRNYQPVSGSFFISPNLPTAISKDGDLMALLVTSPNNYNRCDTIADCSGVGQHCGESKRCTVLEVTVHFFDLNNVSNLNQSCQLDSDCGDVHVCDIPSNLDLDDAVCIPRRVVLGLPDTPLQPRIDGSPKKGCEATTAGGARSYTSASGPLSFDAQGRLYVVARRQDAQRNPCPGELNVPDSDVLAISPSTGDVEVITGNDNESFDAAACINGADNSVNTTDCVLSIKQAVLSPGGNELALRATNPNVSGEEKADETMDVWSVRADGTNREWLGGSGIFDDVESVRVHAKP